MEQWNNFVAEHGPKSGAFLQSFEWGEFQELIGRKVLRFFIKHSELEEVIARPKALVIPSAIGEIATLPAVVRNDKIDGLTKVIKMPLPLGKSYLYVPRGPILISDFLASGIPLRGDKFSAKGGFASGKKIWS